MTEEGPHCEGEEKRAQVQIISIRHSRDFCCISPRITSHRTTWHCTTGARTGHISYRHRWSFPGSFLAHSLTHACAGEWPQNASLVALRCVSVTESARSSSWRLSLLPHWVMRNVQSEWVVVSKVPDRHSRVASKRQSMQYISKSKCTVPH